MVVPLFGNVRNKHVTIPSWDESPYGEEELQKMIKIIPVKDVRDLGIVWCIPDLQPHYRTNVRTLLDYASR